MPSSIAHALFPAGCALASKAGLPKLTRAQWVRFLLIAVFLGNSPDLDLIPASLWPEDWYTIHRYWGHNVFSVTCLILIGQRLLRHLVSREFTQPQAWGISGLLVVSHLFLDCMGHETAYGEFPSIPFLFPASDWSFHLPFQLFPVIELHKGVHPFLGHLLAQDFWVHVVFHEVFFTLVLMGIWTVVFSLSRRLSARFQKRVSAEENFQTSFPSSQSERKYTPARP